MSMYLIKKELVEILKNGKLNYEIPSFKIRKVAYDKKGILLKSSDYTEEKLEKLVRKKKNIKVNLDYWNYNYCSYENIPEDMIEKLSNTEILVDNMSSFITGAVVVNILMHEVILNTYKIKDHNTYLNYLDTVKLSRKIIRNFMLEYRYQLPLTQNYLSLIVKAIDRENIYDFVFHPCCEFNINEFSVIMKNYVVEDIHNLSYYIFSRFKDKKTILSYITRGIEIYEKPIDIEDTVAYTKSNNSYHLGFYLLTMKLSNDLEDQYYYTVKKYLDKNGTLDIIVTNDHNLKLKVEKRKKEIQEYFQKT